MGGSANTAGMGLGLASVGQLNPLGAMIGHRSGIFQNRPGPLNLGYGQQQALGPGPMAYMPQMPEPMSPLTPYGDLQERYKVQFRGGGAAELGRAQGDIARLRGFATSTGPSETLQAQRTGLGQRYDIAAQDLTRGYQSDLASNIARSQAMGGLSGAGAARLGQTGMMEAGLGRQRMLAEREAGMTGLDIAEAQRKQAAMQALPGMEMGLAGQRRAGAEIQNRAEMINKATTLAAMGQLNQAELQKFQTQMQALGAEQSAQAMAGSGKK